MSKINWHDNYIDVELPTRCKKITGTRFAALLGFNHWTTPFKAWCELTRTYQEPYADTKYTIAGKTIEPIQQNYLKYYFSMDNLVTPTDVYGADYFEKTRGDFFPDEKVFGGMWDSLLVNDDNTVNKVIEFKTTSRPEDWKNAIPDYYGLQASLYAYLLGVEDVIMVCSFLSEEDYEHPEQFKPSVTNTIIKSFKLHEKYPQFDEWYHLLKTNYENGWSISPDFDEKLDADILKELRTASIPVDVNNEELLNELAVLTVQMNEINEQLKPLEKRYKAITEAFKKKAMNDFTDGINVVKIENNALSINVSKSERVEIDKDQLKADGLLEKYSKTKEVYTIRVKEL